MNLKEKIIVTDTNIITDLDNAKILDKFISLDNVYISDMVLNDEINNKTGDVSLIKKFKVIKSTGEQLLEMSRLTREVGQLSPYDLINYVIAKDNDYILATGDNRLKRYAEENGVIVIRTLKIIKLMKENSIISVDEAVNACELLLECTRTRIPEDAIKDLINELESELVVC